MCFVISSCEYTYVPGGGGCVEVHRTQRAPAPLSLLVRGAFFFVCVRFFYLSRQPLFSWGNGPYITLVSVPLDKHGEEMEKIPEYSAHTLTPSIYKCYNHLNITFLI